MVGKTKALRIAINMLTCATVFALAKPLPRETISGLVGRKVRYYGEANLWEQRAWRRLRDFIDWLHRYHEPDHCRLTANLEADARRALGYPLV